MTRTVHPVVVKGLISQVPKVPRRGSIAVHGAGPISPAHSKERKYTVQQRAISPLRSLSGNLQNAPLPSTHGPSGRRRLFSYFKCSSTAAGNSWRPIYPLTPWPTSPALPYCSEISRLPATPPDTLLHYYPSCYPLTPDRAGTWYQTRLSRAES
ncbi:hypothetical protein QC762_0108750 [Podospora pseudocomata]|uniref:Uncharacterized protein n=1 Tax=Podospora pseudocomata TaxID=2093779 RepID=A0ABR0G3J4_9PEZI|nr:hypothetical protein QC762_0108750 [Podospora pseudocomata]